MFPNLDGVYTALVTPFAANGQIDYERLARLIHYNINGGVRGLVPVGTTGESCTLTPAEHDELIRFVIRIVNRQCLVIAGCGSNSTSEAMERVRSALEAGADGVLLVDAYYNRPGSRLLATEYYLPLAQMAAIINSNAVVIPYIIPARTATKLEPEDLAWLAQRCPNIRAVKEATGDFDNMARTRSLLGGDFTILSGDDGLTHEMMSRSDIHANGVISVISNLFPQPMCELVGKNIVGRQLTSAIMNGVAIHTALTPVFNCVGVNVPRQGSTTLVDRYPNPIPIKTMMAGLGCIDTRRLLRRPLGLLPVAGVRQVQEALRQSWQAMPTLDRDLHVTFHTDIAMRAVPQDDARSEQERQAHWEQITAGRLP